MAEVAFVERNDPFDPPAPGDLVYNPLFDPTGVRHALLIGRFSGAMSERRPQGAARGDEHQGPEDASTRTRTSSIVGGEMYVDENGQVLPEPMQPTDLPALPRRGRGGRAGRAGRAICGSTSGSRAAGFRAGSYADESYLNPGFGFAVCGVDEQRASRTTAPVTGTVRAPPSALRADAQTRSRSSADDLQRPLVEDGPSGQVRP